MSIEGTPRAPLVRNEQINVYVPDSVRHGVRSVIVYVDDALSRRKMLTIANANPALFTAKARRGRCDSALASGMRYTLAPFPARFNNNSLRSSHSSAGLQAAATPVPPPSAGDSKRLNTRARGDFPGLDQINLRLPR